MTAKHTAQSPRVNTQRDFINAGYSKARAAELSQSPAHNWKAANGGKRAAPRGLGHAGFQGGDR